MKRSSTFIAALLIVVLPLRAVASDEPAAPTPTPLPESTPPVPIGSRVRIETPDGRKITGTLLSWDSRSAEIKAIYDRRPVVFDPLAVRTVERSKEQHRSFGRVVGSALVGLGAGVIALAIGDDKAARNLDYLNSSHFYLATVIPTALGALMGARKVDQWERVRLSESESARSASLNVAVGPAKGGGARGAVSISWK